ncbi:MAG: ral nucleoside transport system permease protein [Clostridiales bacterium]|nr:ral nucleoside transport system permease protein [Clostridiales bacterium]MDN5299091.1 ral nucleoside transport system permease protein [Clostridiales bacterium]
MQIQRESKIKIAIDNIKFPLLAIVFSFIIGAFFIIWTGNNPGVAYVELFSGSLGTVSRFGETMLKTTPLIFTGLAVGFGYRCGLFNIGVEGQYILGTVFTISAGWIFRDLPGSILPVILLISGALGGAIWAFIPGILKAKRGVNEVIITIMLNYTALYIANYVVRAVLNPSILQGTEKKAYSVMIPEQGRLTMLTEIFPSFGYSSVNTGIFIAIAMAIITWFILFKTTLGYEVRSVGFNPYASEYGGISIAKNITLAMVISGALAGLAGAVMITGLTYKVDMASGMPGYGFDGIAVALVGKNHPIGILASAFLFGILKNGERKMQIAGIPKEVIGIIQSIIIIFIAAEAIGSYWPSIKRKLTGKKDEEVKA